MFRRNALFGLLLELQIRCSKSLWNVGEFLPQYTESYPRKQYSSVTAVRTSTCKWRSCIFIYSESLKSTAKLQPQTVRTRTLKTGNMHIFKHSSCLNALSISLNTHTQCLPWSLSGVRINTLAWPRLCALLRITTHCFQRRIFTFNFTLLVLPDFLKWLHYYKPHAYVRLPQREHLLLYRPTLISPQSTHSRFDFR
jgi:hypothetical protein